MWAIRLCRVKGVPVSQTERIYKIHRLLENNRAPSLARIMEELEVSRATVKRDIEYMRCRLQAPIEYDRERGGYCYAAGPGGEPYQLPGIWLTSEELHALLLIEQLLGQLDSRLLAESLKPIGKKIESLLTAGKLRKKELHKRFKIIGARHRPVEENYFRIVSTAVLQRKQLEILYFSRSRGEIRNRTVSPQRLIWYSSNWYLDAWCHMREDFRSFALDALRGAKILPEAAKEFPPEQLDARLGAGYGIFAGAPDKTAVLRFRVPASRWAEREEWHPKQRVTQLEGGEVRLEVPYSDPRELVQDILRFVPHVVVEAPDSLRQLVLEHLEGGLAAMRAEQRKPAAGEARFTAG